MWKERQVVYTDMTSCLHRWYVVSVLYVRFEADITPVYRWGPSSLGSFSNLLKIVTRDGRTRNGTRPLDLKVSPHSNAPFRLHPYFRTEQRRGSCKWKNEPKPLFPTGQKWSCCAVIMFYDLDGVQKLKSIELSFHFTPLPKTYWAFCY
jgi:hypothetical protein